ncbi:Hypothetical predicted protein [Cloeon dipterum]|uniref:Derlin n=1 Tax=Cloeon dipterum TaxID=197152 RepID=A0A8S1C0L5_9INSE|nr:Hypothetical predicted protein [Cloeon dipterum]
MADVGEWFKNLPRFTRWWLGLTVGFTLLGRFGLLSPQLLYLQYESFVHKFQIWRAATALFFYPLSPGTGFHFLINLYFLYNYSLRLETGFFDGHPADYFFMLIFNWLACLIISLMAGMPFLMDPMVLSVLYVWCQLNKDVIVNFWFGTQFKAMYLPWVLFAFNLIISGGGFSELIGILVGHLYYFLTFTYPIDFGGANLLNTPAILYQYFPNTRSVRGVAAQAGAARADFNQRPPPPERPRGHDWGQGQVLGGR